KLLFLGTINDNKGIFDLLEAFYQNLVFFSGRVLLSIGGVGESARLQKEISEKELGQIVNYLGWVNHEDKRKQMTGCDLVILPSYNEGLPMVLLEAMSYGKPVIATPVGGIPEIVKQKSNGFLVAPGDIQGFAQVLTDI